MYHYSRQLLINCFVKCSAGLVAEAIKRRLQANQFKVIFFALGLLDVIMDKCGTPFHKQVGTPTFMQQLISMMNNKDMPKEVSTFSSTIIWNIIDSNEDSILNSEVGHQIRQIFRYPSDILPGLWCSSKQGSVIPSDSEPVVVWLGWIWRSKLVIDQQARKYWLKR